MTLAGTNTARQLRRMALSLHEAGATDGQLLESFITQKDEAAFEVLVRRHGPMVLGVCRRVVRNHHDAEDAFQTTFLVLARNASSVRPAEKVANWLHGVAYRTALKVRSQTAKRQRREKQASEAPEPEAPQQNHWDDVQTLLDRELRGLPERYRLPIVLCDLEGKSIKEASRQLGWPQGTLAGRLARGRKLLAKRLTNRGMAPAAGSLTLVVSRNVATADVPAGLMSSTIEAATRIAAGQVTGTAQTSGAREIMLLTKLKLAAALLAVAVGVSSVLYLAAVAAGEPPPQSTQGKPALPPPVPPALAGVPRADKPAPTIADVKKAWTAREDEAKSFRVEWVDKYTTKAGSFGTSDLSKPGPHPPQDTDVTTARSFAADGDKCAGTTEALCYYPALKAFAPVSSFFQFDGTIRTECGFDSQAGWTRVSIVRGQKQLGETSVNADNPLLSIYRPLTGGVLAASEFEKYKLSGRTQKIRGAECVEIVLKDAPKNDAIPDHGFSLWCDPARDFLPVRDKRRYSFVHYELEYEYRVDGNGRVAPSGWQITYFYSKGGVADRRKYEVKKVDLGHKFAADAFNFSFKPSPVSRVTVSEGREVKEVYLVRPDGSKRPIAAAERRKGYDELSKTNADGTLYVPAKK